MASYCVWRHQVASESDTYDYVDTSWTIGLSNETLYCLFYFLSFIFFLHVSLCTCVTLRWNQPPCLRISLGWLAGRPVGSVGERQVGAFARLAPASCKVRGGRSRTGHVYPLLLVMVVVPGPAWALLLWAVRRKSVRLLRPVDKSSKLKLKLGRITKSWAIHTIFHFVSRLIITARPT
ncbi:hypothetical protein LZ32DRAFT_271713 [Colletotrichum eremochloae]|nr:hypothetical protein LZ32DRAFT_271713 [Colletotrichum eremochloae]